MQSAMHSHAGAAGLNADILRSTIAIEAYYATHAERTLPAAMSSNLPSAEASDTCAIAGLYFSRYY